MSAAPLCVRHGTLGSAAAREVGDMTSDGSVSDWIDQLKTGDKDAAAQHLWDRYFTRLAKEARRRLKPMPGGEADEEDLALSAFDSFFRAVDSGRFPELADRNQLWALLVGFLRRKACDYWRRLNRGEGPGLELREVMDRGPTPELAASMADDCRRLLEALGEGSLRQIALLKLENCTDKEIAERLDCGLRTVERKMERIRRIWEKEVGR
jgi:DNA-directed RNA polymerase specialized sigma24 family protein